MAVFAWWGLAGGIVGCGRTPANPLRISIHPWPGYESMHLAQSLGYFAPSEVRLVELANASQSALALRNGTVDAALLTLDEVLVLRQDSVDVRVVLVMDVSAGADAVLARPEIATLWDLRGKRIGVELGTVGAVVLDAMLAAGQLTAKDVQLVTLPVNEQVAAFRAGRVDAVVTYEPARSALLGEGAHVLYDSSRIPERIIDVLVVRAEALEEHRPQLAVAVAAHFRALRFFGREPLAASRELAPLLGCPVERVLPQFAGLRLPDLAMNRQHLGGAAPRLAQHAAELRDVMCKHGLLERAVPVERLVDPGFLPLRDE